MAFRIRSSQFRAQSYLAQDWCFQITRSCTGSEQARGQGDICPLTPSQAPAGSMGLTESDPAKVAL